MLKKFIFGNLSASIFVLIYLVVVIYHINIEGFIAESQYFIITIFLPMFLLGIILDYLVRKNTFLDKYYKIITQILPGSLFLLYGYNAILSAAGRSEKDSFKFIFWLFLAVPFFMVSINKQEYKKRFITSLIATGIVTFAYLYLTTKTDRLDEDFGITVYIIFFFLIFYAGAYIRKVKYINIGIAVIDAAFLIYVYLNPITEASKIFGWDYEIFNIFEYLMVANLALCIIIRFLDELFTKGKVPTTAETIATIKHAE